MNQNRPDVEKITPRKLKRGSRELVLEVEKYAGEGVSIAYDEEKVIFVRYALPGETVRVKVYKETKDYGMAEPLEIIKPSPDRIESACRYFGYCGGCDYQMLSYEKQLEVKQSLVKEVFQRVGGIQLEKFDDVIRSPEQFYYRNTMTFKVNPKKKWIGFFRKDTKFIVDMEQCLIAKKDINTALQNVRNQEKFPDHNFKVRSTDSGDTTVNWIETEKYEDRPVFEKIRVKDIEIEFKISKDSFFQVNNRVIPLWLEKIIGFLDSGGHEVIYDLYCGIGLITLFVSYFAEKTVGVEVSKSSVKDAVYNLKHNQISNRVEFIKASVEEKRQDIRNADVAIIDPPRKGVDNDTLEILKNDGPSKIIYSSCKPATLARDLQYLGEVYDISQIVYVDMFPNTHHVELLTLLKRKKDQSVS